MKIDKIKVRVMGIEFDKFPTSVRGDYKYSYTSIEDKGVWLYGAFRSSDNSIRIGTEFWVTLEEVEENAVLPDFNLAPDNSDDSKVQ